MSNGTERGNLPARILDRMHSLASKARFSLTLRIAAQYCVQLLRTALLTFLVTAVFLVIIRSDHYRKIQLRIQDALPEDVYSQAVIQDAGTHVRLLDAEDVDPGDWRRKMQYVFPNGNFREFGVLRTLRATGQTLLICHDLTEEYTLLLWMILAGISCDMLRMGYFLLKHRRLDRTVVRPIREMTEKAVNISVNNLSDRLPIEGTKNEFRDLATVINSMLDRLEVSYNSQKQFVSDASHELRTPIAVIQGYIDMLRRWGKDDPQVLDESIEAIAQETASMKDLVQDLLFLARHDKKTLMMEMTQFDPADLLTEVRKEAEMVHTGDSFVLSPLEHGDVQADRNMIKQVIRILMDNAVKYSPDGSTITMGVAMQGDKWILSMQDEGQGISAEEMPKIFERFYRSSEARKKESSGHGLGLSIARIIVVAHGGSIHVRSKPGEGSTFTVVLPVNQSVMGVQEVHVEETPEKPKRIRLWKSDRRKTA